jgi:hypothetical protein
MESEDWSYSESQGQVSIMYGRVAEIIRYCILDLWMQRGRIDQVLQYVRPLSASRALEYQDQYHLEIFLVSRLKTLGG